MRYVTTIRALATFYLLFSILGIAGCNVLGFAAYAAPRRFLRISRPEPRQGMFSHPTLSTSHHARQLRHLDVRGRGIHLTLKFAGK